MKELKEDKAIMEQKITEAITEFVEKYHSDNLNFDVKWGWNGSKYVAYVKVKLEL